MRDLHAFLTARDKDVWVDWEDIPPASAWQDDIDENIDGGDSFVFVVSPDSLASEYCTLEFVRAGSGGKRIVPIACAAVDPALAPDALRQLNWIWCRDGDDREQAFELLLQALDTDLAWARAHTRLLVRAVEWDTRKDASLLLRGRDLESAIAVLAANAGKEPRPTELQAEYVEASRRAGKRRQRQLLSGVTIALALSITLGIVALLQRSQARSEARTARSQALAAQAQEALATDPAAGLDRAIRAVETRRTPQANVALRRAILADPVEYAIPAALAKGAHDSPASVGFSADGSLLYGLEPDGRLQVWRSAGGAPVGGRAPASAAAFAPRGRLLLAAGGRSARLLGPGGGSVGRPLPRGRRAVGAGFAGDRPLVVVAGGAAAWVEDVRSGRTVVLQRHGDPVARGLFSGDGSRVLTLDAAVDADVRDVRTGRLLGSFPNTSRAAISVDGRYVATIDGNSEVWLRKVGRRRPVADLGSASAVLFSSRGDTVVTVDPDGGAGVWRTSDGHETAVLPGFSSAPAGTLLQQFVPGAAFSADGQLLALAGADGNARIWELATHRQVATARVGWANALALAPAGGRLAAMTWDGDVVVARAPGSIRLRARLGGDTSCLSEFPPVVSPDGERVIARARGGAAVWSIGGARQTTLRPPVRPAGSRVGVRAAAFSGDGSTVAAAGAPETACQHPDVEYTTAVWRRGRQAPVRVLPGERQRLALDAHGRVLAADRSAVRVATGQRLPALGGMLALGPDGRLALVGRPHRGPALVEVASGRTVAELPDERQLGGMLTSGLGWATFSPDSRRLLTSWYPHGPSGVHSARLWDTATGEPIPLPLGRREQVAGFAFGDRGRLALLRLGRRAAVFDTESGKLVASAPGVWETISDDGAFAAAVAGSGIRIADLRSGVRSTLGSDTARTLGDVTFGPDPGLLVARDAAKDIHVVRCEICRADGALLELARAKLRRLAQLQVKRPPVVGGI